MKQVKAFISKFLELESRALSNDTVRDLEKLNASIYDMQSMIHGNVSKAFSPKARVKLKSDIFYSESIIYVNRHLYKLSSYKNNVYGDIWVSYMSGVNPIGSPKESRVFESFIITEIENELKIIGVMSVGLNESSMEPSHWKGSVYNPEGLNIKKLGEFISTERYKEPKDDGFSMEDYLAEK